MKLLRYITPIVCAASITFSANANENQAAENAQKPTVQQAIDKFASHESLRNASFGVQVVSIDSLKVIGEHNPLQSNITASTMKTVTSATALKLLGKDFTFKTQVIADGKIHKKGRIEGDLIVRGGGDPTLGSQHFPDQPVFVDEVIKALKEKGIKEIKGNIVVDESLYSYPYAPASWMVEDLAYGYGTGIHALNFADNTIQVKVNIAKDKFEYTTSPNASYLTVKNLCNIVDEFTDSVASTGLERALDEGSDVLYLSGNVKPMERSMTIANPSPDLLLRDSLETALKAAGIKIKHKNIKAEKKGSPSLLMTYNSPKLSKIVKSLLERSDNMFTECVLRAIAVNSGKQGTSYNGVKTVTDYWKNRGVDVTGLFMLDGSGLSRTNKAPVSFFTHMLSLAYNDLKEAGIDFPAHFPIAGKTGTVRRLAADTKAAGKFALKSGSMSHVQCYVGYYPVNDPKYAVAILINSFTCPRSELVKNVGTMLEAIDASLSDDK